MHGEGFLTFIADAHKGQALGMSISFVWARDLLGCSALPH